MIMMKMLSLLEVRLAENIIRDNGVDINASGKEGINILFWSMFCNLDQIEFLLKNGASPNFIVKSNCRLHLIGYGESDTIFKDNSNCYLVCPVKTGVA